MWFGDYPDFPGRVLATGELLADYLRKDKQTLLGDKVVKELDGQLPFLPKILSISKALPLQIHPNKDLAAKLHNEDPENFTDPNHKPEIAVALSRFEVFAGWKPLSEITPAFNLPALRRFIPDGVTTWSDETLRQVTRRILLAPEDEIEEAQNALASVSPEDLDHNGYILDLLPRLREQYGPGDPGTIVALLCMNFLVLEPGEALFVPADGIHAYLSGDIVECMARSNNVLNTGFCPAAGRDSVELFSRTLKFAPHSKEDVALPRKPSSRGLNGKTVVFKPPISEFDMLLVGLGNEEEEVIAAGEGPGVAIVTSGEGLMEADGKSFDVKAGYIFYTSPGVDAKWKATKGLEVYIAVV
ncbi:mannose-6-phosphate isomerase [Plectosphaerella plurivora]|uniref:Mannose-6-phosphate isomerase n=1 Tax=Plectosphaerella plurivora TaxID=936078 RepID=A0A9P9A8G8_9PEZI|nr:mannose-6-phosphate isomerase [Plectosphaerella plurivora]